MPTKNMLDIAKERFVSFETERAKAAALIAQVEATRAQSAILERIAIVLEGVYDPNTEMLRVEAWNYDTRRELG